MPVRKVSNHGGNAIGGFPSTKMERMITFESLLERDFIYLVDYDPAVEWFEEQPLSIEYLPETKLLHYTPDFHLLERGQHVLVECKPERFVETEENRRKFAVVHEWCEVSPVGYRYQARHGCHSRPPSRDKSVSAAPAAPVYVSFWFALYFHGFTEQARRTVFLAVTRRKKEVVFRGIHFKCDHKTGFFLWLSPRDARRSARAGRRRSQGDPGQPFSPTIYGRGGGYISTFPARIFSPKELPECSPAPKFNAWHSGMELAPRRRNVIT